MTDKKFILWWLEVLIWTGFLLFTTWWSYRKGYEECAKDFYQGKMKVDLIEKSDGTIEFKWNK